MLHGAEESFEHRPARVTVRAHRAAQQHLLRRDEGDAADQPARATFRTRRVSVD
jgi:hypothetical protein